MPPRPTHLVRIPRDLEQHAKPLIEAAGDTFASCSRRILLSTSQRRWTPVVTRDLAKYLEDPGIGEKYKFVVRLSAEERQQIDDVLAELTAATETKWKLSSALTAGLYLVWKKPWEKLPF